MLKRILGVSALLLVGCHDSPRDNVMTPVDAANVTRARLVVQRESVTDTTVFISVRIIPGASVGRVGSMTAKITFDTAGLQYLQDESSDDGAVRAANAIGGELRIAAAAANGLTVDNIARFAFRVRRQDALDGMKLQISELHQVDRTNIVGNVTVLPSMESR